MTHDSGAPGFGRLAAADRRAAAEAVTVSPATASGRAMALSIIDDGLPEAAVLLRREARWLELGCGVAGMLLASAYQLPDLRGVGVDIAPDLLDIARGRAAELGLADRVRFTECDARTYADEVAYDLVFWSQGFFPPDTRKATLTNAYARLRPGGVLLCPVGPGDVTPNELTSEVSAAGFAGARAHRGDLATTVIARRPTTQEADMHPEPARAESAFYATLTRLVEMSPGMYATTSESGTRLVYTGLPMAPLNVVAPGPETDLAEIETYADELAGTGVPWSIQLGEHPDPAVVQLAARYGRTSSATLPLLCREIGTPSPGPLPPGGTVREVPGRDHEVYASALAAGYPMPAEMAEVFARPGLLDAPDMTAFVLDVEGEAVATGFNVVASEWVGLFNGSVPPHYRRRGYYRALVAARLQHAVAAGARYAFSQNTPMSRPLYEAIGFQPVTTWTYLTGLT